MRKYIFFLLLGLSISVAFFSCKKSNPVTICTLTTITDSSATQLSAKQFSYDNSGRVTLINISGANTGKKAYSYSGNSIIINTTNGAGTITEIDTVVLNNINQMQSYVSVFPLSDTVESGAYYYDLNGIVQSSIERLNGVVQDTNTYSTVNGDLQYKLEKGETVPVENYKYYTENIPNGDPTNIKQLLYYGAYYYKNVHMLSEFYATGVFYNSYKYTFKDNRIAQVTSRQWKQATNDTVTHVLQYTYSCK